MNKVIKKIIDTHQFHVRGIIKRVTGCYNEDLEQEVYIKAWKNIDSYEEKGKFANWIKTIASNVSKDYLRSRCFKQKMKEENDEEKIINISDKQNPEKSLSQKERQKIIITAINDLPPKFKEVVMLFDIEDMSYEEISIKINCPVGTVKSRLFNARKKLYEKLKDLT